MLIKGKQKNSSQIIGPRALSFDVKHHEVVLEGDSETQMSKFRVLWALLFDLACKQSGSMQEACHENLSLHAIKAHLYLLSKRNINHGYLLVAICKAAIMDTEHKYLYL